ncbi:DUF3013 family protein [Latilactobacillus curvatus]|nr:DUF3013 family protein [Latilactobacillus curvatus]
MVNIMAEMDMLAFFDAELDDLQFSGDMNINWDKQARAIELEFTLNVTKEQVIAVEDQNGELNESDEISYEDAILFFDESKMDGFEYADNYLAVIPFAGRKGLNAQVGRGFFNYLQDLLDEGEDQLAAFVNDESDEETFILNWDDTVFQATVAQADDQLAKKYYAYPKY